MISTGVIGLGNIGSKVAGNLLDSGFDVSGYDIVDNDELRNAGVRFADSVSDLVNNVDVVLLSLPSVEALNATVSQILSAENASQTIIDISSYPLADKKQAADQLFEKGISMLDCEISGLPVMVKNRTAVIFKSGDKQRIDAVEEVFEGITPHHIYLGEFGTATKMKLLANSMVFIHNMLGAEVLNLAAKSGLDPELVFNTLKNSAAGSTIFTNKAPIMLNGEFENGAGPFRHMYHYLSCVAAMSETSGAATPLISVALEYCQQAEREGRDDQDIAAMIEILEKASVG